MNITNINHITLAITDIDRSFRFYKEILGFKPLVKWDKGAYFLVGDFWFCLNVDLSREPQLCYTHYAFSVSSEDFESMADKIKQSGAPILKRIHLLVSHSIFLIPMDINSKFMWAIVN